MALRTSKLIVCIDTLRDGTGEREPLRNVRILSADTLRELGASQVGAWREKEAVLAAIEDFYEKGGFRSA